MKKIYFVLLINNKSKNIFENNMNKKQLTESIMVGVRRAFRENKSLNEGFSQWKEQNVPKLDYEMLKSNILKISEILGNFLNAKYMSVVSVVYHSQSAAAWTTIKEMSTPSVVGKGIYDAINLVKHQYCENDEEQLIKALGDTYIKMNIFIKSHLTKYISSTLVPGSNKIKDMQYFTLVKVDDNKIGLKFSIKSLIDNGNEIIEYFSKIKKI